jgi:hypothetical protein
VQDGAKHAHGPDVARPASPDLVAALEFSRLHKYFAARTPDKANEKTTRIIDRAREEAWSVRRIQGYIKAIISGATKHRSPPAAFSDEQRRLTVYVARLSATPADARAQLRLKLEALLVQMAQLEASKSAADTPSSPGAVNVD